ncbi:BspA family leucine-rich repeat surface protein [Fulvivirga sp. M361]|uniref:BspA family leucine-rich repeat surface protein n=1 Tax=Fulvivirga sp. M361 TaxID=2594266 RepID=UPI00117B3931|nr:BspA family leucine-rich repeat surface protein [Fulvivirga sp. M361]TRX58210.1 BspA family leucine-rich repeat surface protein [Fulvivirga sp. M361]
MIHIIGVLKRFLLLLTILFVFCHGQLKGQSFITTWQTDNPGTSNDNEITIPTTGGGYNYTVDWGDGTMDAGVIGNITHTYAVPGTYTVAISGTFPRIFFNNGGDRQKILTVEQWGDISWTSMVAAFRGCTNLTVPAPDVPDLSGVTDMSSMFRGASAFNSDISGWNVISITTMVDLFRETSLFNQPLNAWTVDNVTDMESMFFFANSFNQDLSGWNVSSVTNMRLMFGGASSFNQNIGGWTVDNVTNMDQLFAGAQAFNQDISGWNMSNVTNIRSMFSSASAFNQDISGWTVSSVTNMSNLFRSAVVFDQDISGWVVDNVTNMRGMFSNAQAFNQNISSWNVDNVTDMNSMFENAVLFNQNISGWAVGSVNDMNSMFAGATAFNQDITGWNISSVQDMRSMFSNASSFDQNLGVWDVSNVRFMFNMFNNSGLSLTNYDNLLIGWAALPSLRNNVNFGASGIFYCSAQTARDFIISSYNWFFTDAGQGCIAVYDGGDTSGTEITNGQSEAIDYGSGTLGVGKIRSFTIENRLAVDITNLDVTITGTEFSTAASLPTTLTAGTTLTIDVDLLGTTVGSFTETLSITSDNFSNTFEFILTGVVTATPEPEIVVFEGTTTASTQIQDGQTSPFDLFQGPRGTDLTREITITNIGAAALNISNISITGTAFTLGAVPPTSIVVDGMETIQIVLSGVTSGVFSETLTITNNDSDEAIFNFDVEGEIIGPDIAVFDGTNIFSDPEIFDGQVVSLDLGSGSLGVDVVRQITIANFNASDLTISDISITGTAFSLVAATPITIDAEIDGIISRVTLDLVLSGAAPGSFDETLTITSDDDDEPLFDFPVSGEITGTPAPEIAVFDVSPATEIFDGQAVAIDYGSDTQGNNINRQFIIENQGSSTLNISSISVTGTAFSLVGTAPPAIASGNSETIEVILSGSSTGTFTEVLTITNNDSDEAIFNFTLTGVITATPTPEISLFLGPDASGLAIMDGQASVVNLGSADLGTDINQTFTISNTGSGVLTISNIAITGTAFSSLTATPLTVTAGNINNFMITLSGASVGTFNETLTITSDDADEASFDFPITGTITMPNTLPTISTVDDVIIDEDGATGNIPFTIGDAESLPGDLIVTATSDNTTLITDSGIMLGGTGTSRLITLTPEPDQNGSANLTLTVDDGVATISETFVLTVNAVNDAPLITGQVVLSTPQNTTLTLDVNDVMVTDPDNNFPTGFTLFVNSGNNYTAEGTTITPATDFAGALNVPVVVNDGQDDSPVFDLLINVIAGEIMVEIDGISQASGGDIVFDDVLIGTQDTQEFIITNTGTIPLIITNITISGDDFRLISPIPDPIASGGSSTLLIAFSPTTTGVRTGRITIESTSAEDFTATLTSNGLSEAPPIEIFNVVTVQANNKHDHFEIRNIEFYDTNRVFIYNRWGNEVYKTTDYDNTNNRFIGLSDSGEELIDGTYYYVIELNSGEITKNGFFLLRR